MRTRDPVGTRASIEGIVIGDRGPSGATLITGASSGIGEALATLFASNGRDIVLVARNEGRLRELTDELSGRHGVHAWPLAADLADGAAPARISETVLGYGTDIDVLVNNAGFGMSGTFAEMEFGEISEMIQVNVTALTALTRLLLPGMIRRQRGWILNVASTAAYVPGPLMAVYYASKAYVLSLSEALANELKGSGVSVTALCPGPTRTGFSARANVAGSKLFRSRVMTAEAVARSGYEALFKGKPVVIPGVLNRWPIRLSGLVPRTLLASITRGLNESPSG